MEPILSAKATQVLCVKDSHSSKKISATACAKKRSGKNSTNKAFKHPLELLEKAYGEPDDGGVPKFAYTLLLVLTRKTASQRPALSSNLVGHYPLNLNKKLNPCPSSKPPLHRLSQGLAHASQKLIWTNIFKPNPFSPNHKHFQESNCHENRRS